MRITINGIDFTKDADLSSVNITAGLNEADNTINVTSTDTIKLSGEAAKYVNNIFFVNPCEGKRQEINISLFDDCCKEWFNFIATAQGAKKCSDCQTDIVLAKREQNNCYERLKQKVFWENGFKDAYKHPQIWYVNRPPASVLLTSLSNVVAIIGRIIIEICNAISFISIGAVKCDSIKNFFCNWSDTVTGNNWKTPAPYIRNILEFGAKQCGLKLKSSIFQQSIYKDVVLFQNQYERGRKIAVNWIEDNGANLTVLQLLDKLKPVFNLDYRIRNGFLIVERKDYFDAPENIIFDLSNEDYCITFDMSDEYANWQGSYKDDATDNEGNRLFKNYDDRVEWNAENSTWKKGTLTQANDFGRARFMFDSKSFEKDGFFDFDLTSDQYSKVGLDFIGEICKDNGSRRDNDLIISTHTPQNLKLLLLEPNTNLDDAKVIKRVFKEVVVGSDRGPYLQKFYDYNYPMWYNENEPNGLYQNFHKIDNPNLNNSKIIQIEDLEIDYDCDSIKLILDNPSGMGVRVKEGVGIPTTWEINFNTKKVKINGLRVKCAP